MTDIKINEEYAKLVPPMTDKEYQGLKLSIEVDGQHHPITLNQDGYIIDGHHRFRACKELKRQCGYEVKQFSSKTEEINFMVDANSKRSHLNDFQKAELGYNSENLLRKYAKARQLSCLKQGDKIPVSGDTNGDKGRTADKIGSIVGISASTYNRAKKIIESSPESVKEKLRSGKTTINKECNKLRVAEIKNKLINETPLINLPHGCDLRLRDFNKICENIPDNSIDLILTDPPYAEEHLRLYEQLGVFAQRVLKEGGSLVTFPNYKELEGNNLIEKAGLEYCRQFCVKLNGHHGMIPVHGTQVVINWKSLAWFIKGEKTQVPARIEDFIESQPVDKAIHEWVQSTVEAEHIIKAFTVESQIVCDPMMGSGTNGIAALKLNRKFIGIDIDPVAFSNAQRRLSSLMVTKNVIKQFN